MKNILFLTILFTFQSFLFAQSSYEIEQKLKGIVSDQELETIKNLPSSVQEKILLELNKSEQASNQLNDESIIFEDSVINMQDNSTEAQSENADSKKRFGYEFFSGIPTTFTPINDIPVPSDYVIGIGDVLQINFRGQKTGYYDLLVDKSGQIYIPEIGEVSVQGLTFYEVKLKVKQLFEDFYISVEPSVSMKQLKFIQVTILGAVKNPGSYLVNPFTSASNLLSFAGGLEEYASLRNIEVKGSNESKIDLYELLIKGERSDLILRSGDILFVPTTENFIYVSGAVNRPAYYEYNSLDSFEDLIQYAQGLTQFADRSNFQIKTFSENRVVSKVLESSESIENLSEIIEIHIPEVTPSYLENVYVFGGVSNAGPFETEKFITLEALISDLSLSYDVYPYFAILENTSDNTQKNEYFPFSLHDKTTMDNLYLQPGSKIYLFSKSHFLEDHQYPVDIPVPIQKVIDGYSANINGEFLNNALLPVYGDIKLNELISYVGGFTPNADKSRLELIFPLEEKTLTNPDLDLILNSPLGVSINAPKFNSEVIKVTISGEVNNPGEYPILSGTTLSEVYQKAGNFRNTASSDSIILLREELKQKELVALEVAKASLTDALIEAISSAAASNTNANAAPIISLLNEATSIEPTGRLSGDLSPTSAFSNNLLLQDGDVIIVPQVPQTITVYGEVNNQVTLNFSKELSFREYIDLAGGFKASADKSKIFVIKSNGTSYSASRGLFSVRNINLRPGDTIIVPKDVDRISGLPLVKVSTEILSSVAFSAASLNAIRN